MERTPADIYVVRKRAALSRDPSQHPTEMTSAHGTRSMHDGDVPSSAGSFIDSPIRPATSTPKPFPRTAKRKVSRDAIASDSDARNKCQSFQRR